MIRFLRLTNAERLALGGLDEGQICLETDTLKIYRGTSGADKMFGMGRSKWLPDLLPVKPTSQDDHFPGVSLDPKWTKFEHGPGATITLSVQDSFAILTLPTEAVYSYRGMYQDLPAGDFTIMTKIAPIGNNAGNHGVFICLFQDAANSSGNLISWGSLWTVPGAPYRKMWVQEFTDYNSWLANHAGGNNYPNTTQYYRIRRSGTTLYYEYSSDGIGWAMMFTHAQPWVPLHMGVAVRQANTGLTIYGYYDLFRYIASNQIGPMGRMS